MTNWLEALAEKRDKIRVKANKKIRERNALETQLTILKMEIADYEAEHAKLDQAILAAQGAANAAE